MDLVIGFLAGRRADGAVEIVERKGIGHSETASVQINAADGDALESLYLAVTGTSARSATFGNSWRRSPVWPTNSAGGRS